MATFIETVPGRRDDGVVTIYLGRDSFVEEALAGASPRVKGHLVEHKEKKWLSKAYAAAVDSQADVIVFEGELFTDMKLDREEAREVLLGHDRVATKLKLLFREDPRVALKELHERYGFDLQIW